MNIQILSLALPFIPIILHLVAKKRLADKHALWIVPAGTLLVLVIHFTVWMLYCAHNHCGLGSTLY